MTRANFTLALIAAAALWLPVAHAEDIDVFTGASLNGKPNVLFVVDNTANWNTVFTNEMAALSAAFGSLPVNPDGSAIFNIGIMFTTETGNPNNNVSGGYVRAAIRPMTAANEALYAAMISQFDQLKDKGNAGYSALEMAEAYRYFTGGAPYAGSSKVKADFLLNLCLGCNLTAVQKAADMAVWALPGNALASEYATLSRVTLAALIDAPVYSSGDEGVTEPVLLRPYLPDHPAPAPGTSPSEFGVLKLVVNGRAVAGREVRADPQVREIYLGG